MTLGNLRTRVARVVGMSETGTADLALIDAWANEAVVQFLKDTKVNIATASLSLTADVGNYALDSDILSFTDLWIDSDPDVMLQPMSTSEIVRRRISVSATDVGTRYYGMQGANMIMLYPYPSAGETLHILYVPAPANSMTAAAHDPSNSLYGSVPSEYHPALEAYVKWKAAEAEEHKPSQNGLQFQAEYMTSLSQVRASMNRKSGVFKGRALPGGRGRRSFAGPGVDVR